MELSSILIQIAAIIIVILGFVGLVIPALPGPLLIFGGLVLAAWGESFSHIGSTTIIILGILTFIAYAIDLIAGALGAKHFGGGSRSIYGAALGTIVGMFFGIPGIIIGPFIGAVAGQLTEKNNLQEAGKAGLGTWIGFVFGMAAKTAIAFTMIGIYVIVRIL